MARISTFVIAFLAVSLLVTAFVAFYGSGVSSYDDVTYSDNISQLDQFSAVSGMTTNLSAQLQNQTANSNQGAIAGAFNIPGALFGTAWNTLRVVWQSMGLFGNMLDSGFSNIPVGDAETGEALTRIKVIIGLMVFLTFVFVLISVIANRSDL